MSFQCLQNPRDPLSLKTFEKFEDLYNPAKNRVWEAYRNGRPTVRDFFEVYKSIWTYTYFEEIFKKFERHNTNAINPAMLEHKEFDEYRKVIPEELLPYISFLYRDSGILRVGHFAPLNSGQTTLAGRYSFASAETSMTVSGLSLEERLKVTLKGLEKTKKYVDKFIEDHATFLLYRYDNYAGDCSHGITNLIFFSQLRFYGSFNGREVNYSIPSWADYFASEEFDCKEISIEWTGNAYYKLSRTVNKNYREPIERVLNYSTNPLNIIKGFLKEEKEKAPIFFGVELELSTNYSAKQMVNFPEEPFFICKSDGSVSGACSHPMEVVTIPMSSRMHKKYWADFFSKVDYDNFDTSRYTTNGFHVHFSKKTLTERHEAAFFWFFCNPFNKQFILEISERDSQSLDQWARVPNIGKTDNKGLWKSYNNIRSIVYDTADCNRHSLINISHKYNTIEIRLFKGIVSFADIIKNIDFIEAVLEFTANRWYKTNNYHHFLKWLKTTPRNKYTCLKEFVDHIDLSVCSAWEDIVRLSSPVNGNIKIADLFAYEEQGKIQFTEGHIQLLNAKFNKPLLSLKNGKLVLIGGSKIKHLDRKVEEKYRWGKEVRKESPVKEETFPNIRTNLVSPVDSDDDIDEEYSDINDGYDEEYDFL